MFKAVSCRLGYVPTRNSDDNCNDTLKAKENLSGKNTDLPEGIGNEHALCEWEQSSLWQKWTFSVANTMLEKGSEHSLEFSDLLHTAHKDHASVLLGQLKPIYQRSISVFVIPRLMVSLFKLSWWNCLIVSIFTILEGATRVSMPIVLIYFLRSLQDTSAPRRDAFEWAGILGGVGFCQTMIHHILFFESMKLGWNWKTASTALIHDRLFSLKESILQRSDTGAGKLVNLISNDVARFEEFAIFVSFFWEAFLEAGGILVILIFLLGAPSAIAGVGSTVACIPVMVYLSKQFAGYRGKTAAATDTRVRHIGEMIEGMATVKSYGWEIPLFSLVKSLRSHETDQIFSSQRLRSVNQGFSYCMPTIVSFVTFATYWGLGHTLTLPVVYATMSLLQALRLALGRMWTRSIETTSETIASCRRIESFLDLVPSDSAKASNVADSTNKLPPAEHSGVELLPLRPSTTTPAEADSSSFSSSVTPIVHVTRSSFQYGIENSKPVLVDCEWSLGAGELMMVVGAVGCGKSSLLSAVIGELMEVRSTAGDSNGDKKSSSIQLKSNTRMAYCCQRPWILASSVKSNIVLAGPLEKENCVSHDFRNPVIEDIPMYKLAVESCLLGADMARWPAYDDTEVGERGISVSGGQKARIALARAVYSNADLYLLDDPLSAVDAHVGKILFFDCIHKTLKKRNKAVILVTHQLQYLRYADKIIVLGNDGRQLFYGTYADMALSEDTTVQDLFNDSSHSHSHSLAESPETLLELQVPVPVGGEPPSSEALMLTAGDDDDDDDTSSSSPAQSKHEEPSLVMNSAARPSPQTKTHKETMKRRDIISKEDKVDGNISWSVYLKYLEWGGMVRGFYVLCIILLSQVASMIADYWLRWWASSSYGNQSRSFYIIIFACLTGFCIFVGFYRAFKWFEFTLYASSNLHESALWAVLCSPLQFFISNPSGRILNRFARDTNMADELLPVTLFMFLESIVYCIASVALVCISLPWLCLLVPVLIVTFHFLRAKYIKTAREIKRIEAVTRSPIYADFSATLDGLPTLRAYKLQRRVSRLFWGQVDQNGRAFYSFVMAARWLGFRLDCETALILLAVALLSAALKSTIDVGLIGFTLVYAMSLSGLFQWAVRLSVEVETQMTAIERVHTYSRLPAEIGYSSKNSYRPPEVLIAARRHDTDTDRDESLPKASEGDYSTTTTHGNLQIKKLTVKYRADLDPVLTEISLDIPAGYKVGICGRTGSGKSTLLIALLRLNVVTEGDILLDGQSMLNEMDLETARSHISIIPQDPYLFSGTLRFNLDPFNVYTDQQIWCALKDAHIYDYICTLGDSVGVGSEDIGSGTSGGLLCVVEESGKNFSVGQRQLLSLCRAILRKSKVVLMDEVTASIDFATDRLIQATLRSSPTLRSATIITVAHRLRTIADSDLICTIADGKVAEFDSPINLINREGSHFRQLALESSEFTDIQQIARTSKFGIKGYNVNTATNTNTNTD